MSEHTPGPWTATWAGMEQPGVFIVKPYGKTAVEESANARLIAAAPDLLEACKAVVMEDGKKPWADVVAGIRAAIAKATEGGKE